MQGRASPPHKASPWTPLGWKPEESRRIKTRRARGSEEGRGAAVAEKRAGRKPAALSVPGLFGATEEP